jgi:hypothetical protein
MLSLVDYEKGLPPKIPPCTGTPYATAAIAVNAGSLGHVMALRSDVERSSPTLQQYCDNTQTTLPEERANLWVIKLGDAPSPSCMAIRVGPRTLMTAGHCIQDNGKYKSNLPGGPAFQCKRLGPAWVKKTQYPPNSVVDSAVCTLEGAASIPGTGPYETVSLLSQPSMKVVGVSTTLTCGTDTLDWRKFLVSATLASPRWTMDFSQVGSIPICPTDSGGPVYTATPNVSDRRLVGTVSGHWGLDVLAAASVAAKVSDEVSGNGAICHDGMPAKPNYCR